MRFKDMNHFFITSIFLSGLVIGFGCGGSNSSDGPERSPADAGEQKEDADGSSSADTHGDADTLDEELQPEIVAQPTEVIFAETPSNAESPLSVEIRNLGEGTLRITRLVLSEDTSGRFDADKEFFEVGEGWHAAPIVLEQSETHTIEIEYRPRNLVADQGKITIHSNDPVTPELVIPIVTQAVSPAIYSPTMINFGHVELVTPEPGEPAWPGDYQLTSVENAGTAPLRISDIFVQHSDRFRFSIPHPTPEERNDNRDPDPANDTTNWPELLAPGEQFNVRVWFKPEDENPASAMLVIESNDPQTPIYRVDLLGNAG